METNQDSSCPTEWMGAHREFLFSHLLETHAANEIAIIIVSLWHFVVKVLQIVQKSFGKFSQYPELLTTNYIIWNTQPWLNTFIIKTQIFRVTFIPLRN
jgi:hypothetical protein